VGDEEGVDEGLLVGVRVGFLEGERVGKVEGDFDARPVGVCVVVWHDPPLPPIHEHAGSEVHPPAHP
jgi:hypothetical protein